jgi:cytoskeletal protein RodZ
VPEPLGLEIAGPPRRPRVAWVVLLLGIAALGLMGVTRRADMAGVPLAVDAPATTTTSVAALATTTTAVDAPATTITPVAAPTTTTTAVAARVTTATAPPRATTTTSVASLAKVSTTTTTTAPTTTVVPATTATTTPTSTTAAPSPTTVPIPSFCSLAAGYVQDLRQMAVSLTDPPRLRSLAQHASLAIAQSVAGAPPEVKADVAVLATTIPEFTAALEAADYELAKLPPDKAMMLQSPPVMTATSHIDNYVRTTCAPSPPA